LGTDPRTLGYPSEEGCHQQRDKEFHRSFQDARKKRVRLGRTRRSRFGPCRRLCESSKVGTMPTGPVAPYSNACQGPLFQSPGSVSSRLVRRGGGRDGPGPRDHVVVGGPALTSVGTATTSMPATWDRCPPTPAGHRVRGRDGRSASATSPWANLELRSRAAKAPGPWPGASSRSRPGSAAQRGLIFGTILAHTG